jgi:hypothetical protein
MAAMTEATETYRVNLKKVNQTTKTDTTAIGINAKRTPAEVATPFPPRNQSQIGKVWPRTQAIPAAIPTSTLSGADGI